MMKKQTKRNKLSKLGKLLLIIILCVTILNQSSYTAIACDWPKVQGYYSWTGSIPYYCSPGLHFSFSWEKDVAIPDDGIMITPYITYDNKLYYAEEDRLCIADIDTGKTLRIIDDRKYLSSRGALSIIGDKLIVEATLDESKEQTCALNVDTLETEWVYEHPVHRRYYPARGNDEYSLLSFYDSTLVCLDLVTGKEVWTLEGTTTSPTILENKFVVRLDDSNLRCYSIDTLETIWTIDTLEFGSSLGGVSVHSDQIYFLFIDYLFESQNISVVLCTIDANAGKILWHSEKYTYYFGISPSIASNQSSVFVSRNELIYCFDKDTGKELWVYSPPDGGNRVYNLTATEKTLYYTDNGIYTIDTKNGKLLSYLETETDLSQSGWTAGYANRRLIFFDIVGRFICFDGTAKARYKIDSEGFKVNDNEYKADISPLIKNNRTLLSVRYVIDPLGGDLTWEPDKQKVTCSLLAPRSQTDDLTQKNTVELWIGNPIAKINGIEVQIDPNNPNVVPVIIDGRTMIPMRFLAESLGCSVEWIAESKEIVLTYTP